MFVFEAEFSALSEHNSSMPQIRRVQRAVNTTEISCFGTRTEWFKAKVVDGPFSRLISLFFAFWIQDALDIDDLK
jgi:hypothetical protein